MTDLPRNPKVLVVDDDPRLRDLLRRYLGGNDFSVTVADGGQSMNRIWMRERFDALILDLMMPGEDGLQILRRLRAAKDTTPIIMLTAKGQEEDKVIGLSAGADDYVTKPFSVPELLARIKTNLRRVSATTAPVKKEYIFQDITLNMVEKKIFRGENYVRVGPTEFRILQLLISNPRQVFSRKDLLKEVWGNSVYVELRTVDVHIRRLRKVLNEFGPDYIRTIRATGYSLDDHEIEEEPSVETEE